MTAVFTLFIASLVGMVAMVVSGSARLKSGKLSSVFGHKVDQLIHRKSASVKKVASFANARTASLLFHFLLDKVEGVFIKVKDKSHTRVDKFLSKRRGSVENVQQALGTTTRKTASFFITHIKEHKSGWKRK